MCLYRFEVLLDQTLAAKIFSGEILTPRYFSTVGTSTLTTLIKTHPKISEDVR